MGNPGLGLPKASEALLPGPLPSPRGRGALPARRPCARAGRRAAGIARPPPPPPQGRAAPGLCRKATKACPARCGFAPRPFLPSKRASRPRGYSGTPPPATGRRCPARPPSQKATGGCRAAERFPASCLHPEAQRIRCVAHTQDHTLHELVERDAHALYPAADDIAIAPRRKVPVLELLFDELDLHVHHAV